MRVLLGTPGSRNEQRAAAARAVELLGIFGDPAGAPPRRGGAFSLSCADRSAAGDCARARYRAPGCCCWTKVFRRGHEPRSAETQELMADIMKIRDRGVAIVVIEHDMRLVRGASARG